MHHLYILYKIINKINNKFYIGVHKTKDINDNYYGSGHKIKAAIQKHGKENFYKEILYVYTNKTDAFKKEKELVTEKLVRSSNCYNIKEGGSGGFDHVRAAGLHRSTKGLKIIHNTITNKIKKVTLKELCIYLQNGWALGFSSIALQRMSNSGKVKIQSVEHRKKNSEAKKNSIIMLNLKTNIKKFIKKEKINEYLNNGWEVYKRRWNTSHINKLLE